ncbi:MAG: hypothetical protein M2R45_03088 [Verrucomicrobia subdivision 3 bacterium]|nr:hypothetical protein [Limisphaerales bacterium]MCS1416574.1 hypothetical protein [Limisphaerales bacterium]
MDLLRFILLCVAGWINQQQQDAIAYISERRCGAEGTGGTKQLKFTNAQCRRFATKARKFKLEKPKEMASIVTPILCLRGTVGSLRESKIRVKNGWAGPEHIFAWHTLS